MNRNYVTELAYGDLDAVQQRLWNCHATWPEDFSDTEQNPHGRPVDYWCPTVNGETVGWEGVSGWTTKSKAIEIGRKFQRKCIDWLKENSE